MTGSYEETELTRKKISPEAIVALQEALSKIYWYKKNLKSFLHKIFDRKSTARTAISRLNWDNTKIEIVGELIDAIYDNELCHDSLLHLCEHVANFQDFSHLARIDDGIKKKEDAKNSVLKLRKIFNQHKNIIDSEKKQQQHKLKFVQTLKENKHFSDKLESIRTSFLSLETLTPQKKGFQLEKILYDLFVLFDLDPKAAFKNVGEQIDGAFSFDSTEYLLEAKWEKTPISSNDIYTFAKKVESKLDNTLGLLISMSGFSSEALKSAIQGSRPTFFLMDGQDLAYVLEARVRLDELLKIKKRHASQKGEVFLPINNILNKTN